MKFKTFRAVVLGGGVVLVAGGFALCVARSRRAASPSGAVAPSAASAIVAASSPVPSATAPSPSPAPSTPSASATQASASSPASSSAAPVSPVPLRPIDREILAKLAAPLGSDAVKDAFPGRPYRVELHQDAGHTRPNRVKIDLNRNGKWDEKWNVEADPDGGPLPRRVKREVSPADDETYTQAWRLEGDAWTPLSAGPGRP